MGRLRRRWGHKKPLILLGGIYPSIAPEHAAQHVQPDLVVVGEVEAANDLWPDLSLYATPPGYAIITPARGCPFNCAYCAQLTINGGQRRVRYTLNAHYRSRSFRIFGDTLVARAFRGNMRNGFEEFLREQQGSDTGEVSRPAARSPANFPPT